MFRRAGFPIACLVFVALAGCSTRSAIVHESVMGADMPRALGPYSHAVRAGDFLFTSGQVGIDPETGIVAEGFQAQARLTFENLARVLRASGSDMSDVVRTTVFMADATQFEAMNALFAEYFPTRPPVRSTPIVQLPRGLLISVDAMAVAH